VTWIVSVFIWSVKRNELSLRLKKAAKDGNREVCTVLAKQLVQLRKQKTRTYNASSRVQSVGAQAKVMQSSSKMAEVMGTTTKAIGEMNKIMNPQKMNKTMQEFGKEAMKMEMTDEMISDTMDDILNESGDEEESDQIVNQILDEIGIEISGKMAAAPAAEKGKVKDTALPNIPTGDELEAQLARLRTS